MIDRIDALKKLVRLRERDVRQCEKAIRAARALLSSARKEAEEAEHAFSRAAANMEEARVQRQHAPADSLAHLRCHTTEAVCEHARHVCVESGNRLTEAATVVDRRCREWHRAQTRYETLANELMRELRRARRKIVRVIDDEPRTAPQAQLVLQ